MSERFTIGIFGFRRSEQIIIDCFLKKEAADHKQKYDIIHKVSDVRPQVAFVNADYVKSQSEIEIEALIDYLYNIPCVFALHKGDNLERLVVRFTGGNKIVTRPVNFSSVAGTMVKMLDSAKKAGTLDIKSHQEYCVLVVDDSRSLRTDMQLKLTPLGIDVDVAEDGNQALRDIGKRPYQLVFMDIMMPGKMDGFEACRLIKRLYPDLPVVMLTSKDSMFSKVRGKMAKCDGYITKPASLLDLKEVFDAHVFNR